jgi:hypothetical protein
VPLIAPTVLTLLSADLVDLIERLILEFLMRLAGWRLSVSTQRI